jgi:hypothetical protein
VVTQSNVSTSRESLNLSGARAEFSSGTEIDRDFGITSTVMDRDGVVGDKIQIFIEVEAPLQAASAGQWRSPPRRRRPGTLLVPPFSMAIAPRARENDPLTRRPGWAWCSTS